MRGIGIELDSFADCQKGAFDTLLICVCARSRVWYFCVGVETVLESLEKQQIKTKRETLASERESFSGSSFHVRVDSWIMVSPVSLSALFRSSFSVGSFSSCLFSPNHLCSIFFSRLS